MTAMDVNALNWVKKEIDETLTQASRALEAFNENENDIAQMQFCATYIHQVYGTLQMLELYGASLLAEEMEHLARALAEKRIHQKMDALEVLMRSMIQLPDYLENLQKGSKDLPAVLLPLLNDLRAVQGHALLSENSLFAPDLTINVPDSVKSRAGEIVASELPQIAKKLRTLYQMSLLNWYKGIDTTQNLHRLADVVKRLREYSSFENSRKLWWITEAVIEGLMNGSLSVSVATKLLLGQVDRQIKRLIDAGEDALQKDPDQALVKNLLYYVAQEKVQGDLVAQVKLTYSLEDLVPKSSDVEHARDGISGANQALMATVANAVKEDLIGIKEQLDMAMRGSGDNAENLTTLVASLKRISDTLVMIGLGAARNELLTQIKSIQSIIDGKSQPDEEKFLAMAQSLLAVESAVDGLARGDDKKIVVTAKQEGLSASEMQSVYSAAIAEVINDIGAAKELVVSYAQAPWDLDILQSAPDHFHRIGGTLQVIGQMRCAQDAELIHQYLSSIKESKNIPDDDALNHIADAIAGVEYYLELIRDTGVGEMDALTLAETALRALGLDVPTVEPVAEIPVVELEPSESQELQEILVEEVTPEEYLDEDVPLEEVTAEAEAEAESDVEPEVIVIAQPERTNVILPPVMAASDIDDEILEIFIEEAEEAIEAIKNNFPIWRENAKDTEALAVLRRAFHTLKGSGRMVGALLIGEFSWAFESLLNRVIDQTIVVSDALLESLESAIEELPILVEQLKGGPASEADLGLLMQRAERIGKGEILQVSDAVAQEDIPLTATVEDESISSETEPELMDPVLFGIYNEESRTHLDTIRNFIQDCELHEGPHYITQELYRAWHTLSGSSRMVGECATDIVEISCHQEHIAGKQLAKCQPISEYYRSVLAESVTAIVQRLGCLSSPIMPCPDFSNLMEKIEGLLADADLLEDLSAPVSQEEFEEDEEYAERQEEQIELVTEQDNHEEDLLDIFLAESKRCMDSADNILQSWVQSPEDEESIRALTLILHTLKGGARMSDIASIGNLAHVLEVLFENIRAGRQQASPAIFDAVGASFKKLRDMLQQMRDSGVSQEDAAQVALIQQLMRVDEQVPTVVVESLVEEPPLEIKIEPALEPEVKLPQEPLKTQVFESELTEEDAELFDIFIEEAEEIMDQTDRAMQRWESNREDKEPIQELQRQVHTLKGGARMAGIAPIGDLGHQLENLFEGIVAQEFSVSSELFSILHATFDRLHRLVTQAKSKQPLESSADLVARLEAMMRPVSEEPVVEVAQEIAPPISEVTVQVAEEEEVDEELMDIFLEEAEEIMDASDAVMQAWEAAPTDKEHVKELLRHLHTLKGGARLSRIDAIGDLGHVLESLFEAVVGDELAPNTELFSAVHASLDRLHKMLQLAKERQVIPAAPALVKRIAALLTGEVASTEAEPEIVAPAVTTIPMPTPPAPIPFPTAAQRREHEFDEIFSLPTISEQLQARDDKAAADKSSQEVIRVRADLLDNLVNYAGEASIYRSRLEQEIGSFKFNLDELDQTVFRIKEQLRRMEMEIESQVISNYQQTTGKQVDSDFDALEMDQYSQIQQLSRALAESMNDLGSVKNMLGSIVGQSETLLVQQSRVNTELQEGLMRTRMLPFSSIIPRLRRLVRQVGDELGKSVALRAVGSEGEIDRTVLDRITAPLEHMIRNSIAHGLEMPQGRSDKGKEEEGSIVVRMYREGGEVVIQVADDGAGINVDAVRKKAISQGLLKEDSRITDHEAIQFIFESGFSTATEVSQVAGRGVGMDVVHSEVKQLGGSLDIDTRKDKGTTFTIRLPFTLSVTKALMVQVVDETYAVPLTSIQGVVRLGRQELDAIYRSEVPLFEYGGNRYEMQHLGQLLGLLREPRLPEGRDKAAVLLVRVGDHLAAYQIEGLLGGREIVVKAMGIQLSTVRGISGATILGDGNVVLILDVGTLVRLGAALTEQIREEAAAAVAVVQQKAIKVMVVDDSITVRKVTTRLLHRHEMEVIAAKDGLEAVNMLQDMEQLPDVMLLDIEMPRMDGYEVATHVRSNPRLKNIPIIMITSRTGDKHRDKAMLIGVNRYLGKPFQENILLAEIESVMAESTVH